ncbi:hypothetical protein EX30DRAFT_15891 [Ascodesmis nigricans]|uniref:Uncharacterized protein n=1 Tax=Ascodesmis nigricans TaxID=341454 RepID=A0A4S2N705_9PEZI|nr:hypothetical protein EX30DRAFT_15891 [Ascodesmis nigricans]
MFAINKENLVLQAPPHGGKASNANPKTPGPQKLHPKTPFKIPAGNDENVAGNTANPKTGKKMGMMAQQFITPAPGPRQVLGRKTTNAKARNLAPMDGDLGGSLKPKTPGSSLRPLKSKLTVAHDPEAAIQEEDDIPDIEYIPPRSEEPPLVPDILDPIDYDFINQNLMRGCYRSYLSGVDDNGKTRTQRLLEKSERLENEALDKETALLLADLQNGLQPPPRRTIKAKPSTKPSSASSRLAPPPPRQPFSSHNITTVRHMPREGERIRSSSTSRASSRPTSRTSSHVRQSSTSP